MHDFMCRFGSVGDLFTAIKGDQPIQGNHKIVMALDNPEVSIAMLRSHCVFDIDYWLMEWKLKYTPAAIATIGYASYSDARPHIWSRQGIQKCCRLIVILLGPCMSPVCIHNSRFSSTPWRQLLCVHLVHQESKMIHRIDFPEGCSCKVRSWNIWLQCPSC